MRMVEDAACRRVAAVVEEDVLAEGAEERGAVVRVHRKGTHEIACVLTDLRD